MKAYASAPQVRDDARERLIAEHIEMARRIALRVARRVPTWMSNDDLVAAAMIGLTEAAARYDERRGEPFVAFAEKRIRGAVLDELRRGDILPRRVRSTARKVGTTINDLQQQLGRSPEDEEVASALGVPLEEYREDLSRLTHISIVELQPHHEITTSGESEQAALPTEQLEQAELVAQLRKCLDELEERDALVLSLYYVEELSYAEIGKVLGVSESRVCQLHGRALVRLRGLFQGSDQHEEA